MTRLSVNINKVATLRNARGENVPDVCLFAARCQEYGAEGITVHPRPDERHITLRDAYEIPKVISVEYNMEGYPDERFLKMVEEIRPAQATLVPDAANVLTSCAGWDVETNADFLLQVVERIKKAGVRVSIFVAPDAGQIRKAAEIGADRVELYTKPYADEFEEDPEKAVAPYVKASRIAWECGLGVNAGHDLNSRNLAFFHQSLPRLDEVSIGHAIISDALYDGIEKVIHTYLKCLAHK